MTDSRPEPAADGPVEFEIVSPTTPDAQLAMEAYFAELDARFSNGFDRIDGGVGADADAMSAPDGAFVLARRAGSVVGCGGVLRLASHEMPATAEVKRMWVSADARGIGLGKRLLAELESVAAALGCARVVLDTNASLTEAIAMYERCGYEPIDRYNDNPYADHWFAKTLGSEPLGCQALE